MNSVICAPTAEENDDLLSNMSKRTHAKRRQHANAIGPEMSSKYIPTEPAMSRLSSIKLSFVLDLETIKFPPSVVSTRAVAQATVLQVVKLHQVPKQRIVSESGTEYSLDPGARMFRSDVRQTRRGLGVFQSHTFDRFVRELALQRATIVSAGDRDQFDMLWG